MIAIQGSKEYYREMIRLTRVNRPKWQNDILDRIKNETTNNKTNRK